MKLKMNNKGQTLVEYVLIISLIAVVAIAVVRIFGGYLKDRVTKMGCEMMGKDLSKLRKLVKDTVKVTKIDFLETKKSFFIVITSHNYE